MLAGSWYSRTPDGSIEPSQSIRRDDGDKLLHGTCWWNLANPATGGGGL